MKDTGKSGLNPIQHPFDKSSERNEIYHRMVNEVRDYAIILLDPTGVIVDWNKGAEKIKGYSHSEIIGKKFEIFYNPSDRERKLPQQLLDQAQREGAASHEGWRVKKDGTQFWGSVVITALHDSSDNIIGFSKVTRDLTEKKNSDDRLRLYAKELESRNELLRISEERYHKMISEIQDYAIILLSKDGDIEDWNAGAQLIKGYEAKEILGKNFRIFYTPEDREQKLPETLINLAYRKGKAQHEGWRIRKDGTKFWGSVVITALHDVDNNVIGFSKVTRDLTERKIAEDNLRSKNTELEEMNRELGEMNKELTSFAYISSHDLQEPLRKIQTFSSRILEIDQGSLSEKSLNYFTRIQSAATRMRLLIDDLLSYSRASTADREFVKTDMNKIVKDVLAELETSIEEKKAVIESNELPEMAVIPFQFHQLISNLVSNSLKFARPNSVPYILIRCREISWEKVPGNLRKVEGPYHHLTVSDNGIGFDQEHSQKIFDVFHRLHGRDLYTGTGVGLAICKKIVEHHYGVIRAEGKPGVGATFHVYIPTVITPGM